MSNKLPPVPHRSPMIGPDGFPTRVWADWFQKVFANVGGGSGEDAITELTGDVSASGPGVATASIGSGVILNANVNASAAISRSKIANGSLNHVLINDSSGTMSSESKLAISRGGTNSSTALQNNRVLKSSGGAIIEADAIQASRALISDVNGIPIHSSVTDTELGYSSGVTGAIQTQLDSKQPKALTSGKILIGDGSNLAAEQTVSGDVLISSSGVTSYSGTVPLNKGGTGEITKSAAFDALQPMTASGDLIYGGASGTGTRLAKGTDGQVLTLTSGLPTWETPSSGGTGIPIGGMMPYGGSSAPTDWLLCDGSAISRTTYSSLFTILGTAFGSGDGSTTFNLPDTRNVFLRGANGSTRSIGGITYPAVTRGATTGDTLQGHYHSFAAPGDSFNASGNVSIFTTPRSPGWTVSGTYCTTPVSDGTNGTPRTGAETRPVNLGVNFIIRYQ